MPPPSIVSASGSKKRPPVVSSSGSVRKRIRIAKGASAVKREGPRSSTSPIRTNAATGSAGGTIDATLKEEFIKLLSDSELKGNGGIPNSLLKDKFGATNYVKLAPIISMLAQSGKLFMTKLGGMGGQMINRRSAHTKGGDENLEYYYTLVSDETLARFKGLGDSERMVYQVIERMGNKGIWTKHIHNETSISQQALTKMYQVLEKRKLIKPVRSVKAKNKKLFMLYDILPAKELTGGVWYSDLEFDHEFISELRNFIMHCVRRLNQSKGVTITEIREKMAQAKVSRVELSKEEVTQVVNTLVYDYLIEKISPPRNTNDDMDPNFDDNVGDSAIKEPIYVPFRRVNTMCEFKCWDVLVPDFEFRTIQFEDGITLPPHHYHYHTE